MIFRALNAVMTALFAFAVAVQYNDPDPIRWMAIYGAAGLLSAWVVARSAAPLVPVAIVGTISLVWSLVVMRGVRDPGSFAHMFDSWEMKSPAVEEAREGCGLLIVAAWMAVLAIQAWLWQVR